MERNNWSIKLTLEEKLRLLGEISEDGTEITVELIEKSNVFNSMWEEWLRTSIRTVHYVSPNGNIETKSVDEIIARQQFLDEIGFVSFHNIAVIDSDLLIYTKIGRKIRS